MYSTARSFGVRHSSKTISQGKKNPKVHSRFWHLEFCPSPDVEKITCSQKNESWRKRYRKSLVLIRERGFGKQKGNNNLDLILLLLAKSSPPSCHEITRVAFFQADNRSAWLAQHTHMRRQTHYQFWGWRGFLPQVRCTDLVSCSAAERCSLLPQIPWGGPSSVAFSGNSCRSFTSRPELISETSGSSEGGMEHLSALAPAPHRLWCWTLGSAAPRWLLHTLCL